MSPPAVPSSKDKTFWSLSWFCLVRLFIAFLVKPFGRD